MKTSANFSLRCSLRRLLLSALGILVLGVAPATTWADPIYYSTTGSYDASNTCLTAFCTAGVRNGSQAADANLGNYATLLVGPLAAERLRLDLSGTGAAGYRAGLVVANGTGLLNLQTLGAIRIRTYLKTAGVSQLADNQAVAISAARSALLGGAEPRQLEITATLPFNQVEIEIGGVNGLYYAANIYYAYAVPPNVQPAVAGYVSRFTAPSGHYSTAGTNGGTVCVNTDVNNPSRATDTDLTNYATFSSLATVACPSTLRVDLEGTAPAGDFAGFVIGSAGLLDASVLAGLRLRTYRNGVEQESATGASLLQISVLPNGQAQVHFRSGLAFDAVSIERVGAVTALDNLQLYYGFGVEPRTFDGTRKSLSNFSDPAGHYHEGFNAALCVSCSISTPSGAANSPTDASSFATINVPVGVASSAHLRLDLNGAAGDPLPGKAGNRAGMVISAGGGLLDAAALAQLTINTYDAGGSLLESGTGASLLSVSLLPDGRQEISFNTTRSFASVELQVNSGVAALANTKVFYAFADDQPTGFPTTITPAAPLPVELIAFAARWTAGAALLTWQTASERASSHFVVERSAGSEAGFVPVGYVVAAGSSSSPRSYTLRDAEAAAQHASVLYYRLRQVDLDGRVALSPVVVLTVGKLAAPAALFPNPARAGQAVTLQLGEAVPGRLLRLYSPLGQVVRQVAAEAAELQLPVDGLPAGLYQVSVTNAAGQAPTTYKFVIVD